MITNKLSYRLFRESDLPGVLELWAENTAWGVLSEKTWREWYMNTPFGDCIVVVAEDERGGIAGQEVLTPCQISFGGQEGLGARLSAPILRMDQRRRLIRGADHPAAALLDVATSAAADRGIQVIYSLPDHSWLPVLRKGGTLGKPNLNYQTTEFSCVGLNLEDIREPDRVYRDFSAGLARPPRGPEYEVLWRQAVAGWPLAAAVARVPRWLNWRQGGDCVVETRSRSTGSLVGYGVVNRTTGLLMDLLACDRTHLEPVLAHTLWQIRMHRQTELKAGVNQLKAMAIPDLRAVLERLAFTTVDFMFAFCVHFIDKEWMTQDIPVESWYIAPGD